MLMKPTKIQHDLYKAECDCETNKHRERIWIICHVCKPQFSFSLWPFSQGHLKIGAALLSGIAFSCYTEKNVTTFQSSDPSNESLLYIRYPTKQPLKNRG